jgi:hypothetical protein
MNRFRTIPLLAGLLLATAACSEDAGLAPESAGAIDASASSLAAVTNESADVADLLDRILPALGESTEIGQLRALLQQLEREAGSDVAAARRTASIAAALLDRIERTADESQHADLGVIRLVLDARQ